MYDNFSYATTYLTRQTLKKKSESAVRRTTLNVGPAGVRNRRHPSLPRRRSKGFVTLGAGTRDKALRTSAWEANDTLPSRPGRSPN